MPPQRKRKKFPVAANTNDYKACPQGGRFQAFDRNYSFALRKIAAGLGSPRVD